MAALIWQCHFGQCYIRLKLHSCPTCTLTSLLHVSCGSRPKALTIHSVHMLIYILKSYLKSSSCFSLSRSI